jgi:hypothetical protein
MTQLTRDKVFAASGQPKQSGDMDLTQSLPHAASLQTREVDPKSTLQLTNRHPGRARDKRVNVLEYQGIPDSQEDTFPYTTRTIKPSSSIKGEWEIAPAADDTEYETVGDLLLDVNETGCSYHELGQDSLPEGAEDIWDHILDPNIPEETELDSVYAVTDVNGAFVGYFGILEVPGLGYLA